MDGKETFVQEERARQIVERDVGKGWSRAPGVSTRELLVDQTQLTNTPTFGDPRPVAPSQPGVARYPSPGSYAG